QDIRDYTNSPVDITPVLEHFRAQGPNEALTTIFLTTKLCWLLVVCGFMRPSDIAHTDLSKSHILPSGAVELHVAGPKEKRQKQPIIKSVFIHPHEDQLICPVAAYSAYVQRLEGSTLQPVDHPRLQLQYLPLIRHLRDINEAVGAETIGRHIKMVSFRISRPPGRSMPSGRSNGSSLAVEHGALVDDVQAQGFWAHSAAYDSFYRLSHRSVTNLTRVTLTG
ncbi:hypothetical protein CPB97_000700, partial [Podila verticillata]